MFFILFQYLSHSIILKKLFHSHTASNYLYKILKKTLWSFSGDKKALMDFVWKMCGSVLLKKFHKFLSESYFLKTSNILKEILAKLIIISYPQPYNFIKNDISGYSKKKKQHSHTDWITVLYSSKFCIHIQRLINFRIFKKYTFIYDPYLEIENLWSVLCGNPF